MSGVHALYESVRNRPFIRMPLDNQPYGDWEFEVRDPNGYIVVFGGDAQVPRDAPFSSRTSTGPGAPGT